VRGSRETGIIRDFSCLSRDPVAGAAPTVPTLLHPSPEHAASPVSVADLTACDLEPIRVPGAIQPHGRMLVLAADPADGSMPLAHSANWPADELSGALAELPRAMLADLVDGRAPTLLGAVRLGDRSWALSAHRSGAHLLLEYEEAPPEPPAGEAPIYSLTRVFLPRLQGAGSLVALTDLVASEMKHLSGFGRCLVYRFDADGDGEVLAERCDPGYTSYAGHHFPAGDIPRQARELYVLNPFRLIADARYDPVPLVAAPGRPGIDAAAVRRIDLSQAQLRSVSPVHLEYMRNMGTLASMSVSIVIEGRLWGLISCHDHDPRSLAPASRLACEHLGQLLALQIQALEANRSVAERLELRRLTMAIVARLSDSDATLARLVEPPAPMLELAGATGAAVVLDDQLWTVGDVPAPADIRLIADWIGGLHHDVHATATLADGLPAAPDLRRVAAGVLAISISQVHRHLVLWFRPELLQTITWAGDPRKADAAAGDGRIHPRRSFDSWVETIRGRAAPWTGAQLGAAAELRQALIGIVLRRAEEMAQVAAELGRVNKELEAFSYTVSHDLRAPMRHIAGYVDLVVESEGARLGERALRYLAHAKEASAFAGQLVDGLLDFSRMGRAAGRGPGRRTHADGARARDRLVDRARPAGAAGRSVAAADRGAQPARECGQVLARQPAGAHRGACRAARRWRRPGDRGQRRRLPDEVRRQAVRRLPAPARGRGVRRHRHRPGQRAAHRGAPWGHRLGPWRNQDRGVLRLRAAPPDGPRRVRRRRRRNNSCLNPSCWSRTTSATSN
jgi:chemotaxis family two-component system sensor kinase Cph1